MKGILADNYSYNYTSFQGKTGIWKLVGVESVGGIEDTLDTFKSDSGKFHTMKRSQVAEQYQLGNIKPIPESEVILNTETKKKVGRSI